MTVPRRHLLLGSAAVLASASSSHAQSRTGYKAIAFDGFVIIDPRPVSARAEEAFPGQGAALMEAWRTRQFEYTWLRTLMGRYVDFRQVTREALIAAAKAMKLLLSDATRDDLLRTFVELKAWPDVAPALRALRERDIRMAFLANPPASMFDAVVRNSGLDGLLEGHLSTDRVQLFKPHPRAYRMGLDAFELAPAEIVFAASAAWDAAGSKSFGYPTFWLNRTKAASEELGVAPDGTGSTMADLVQFVLG
jgi:2-haloacid dehalogenase